MTTADGWLPAALDAARSGRGLAVVCDYDGTLVPLTRHPSLARMPEAARAALAGLTAAGVRVGVVSGRPLDELRAFVRLPGVFYAGSSGAELDLLGEHDDDPAAANFPPLADAALAALSGLLGRHPTAWAERKPAGVALHARGLPDNVALQFCEEARLLLAPFPGLRCKEVTRTLEITPAGGWTKATALARIAGHGGADPLPLYAGDGASDAGPMAEALRRGGLAVGVGPTPPTPARHVVPTPEAFVELLARLADGLRVDAPRSRPAVLLVGPAAWESADALAADGWDVTTAAGPADALAALGDAPFRAAVVDMALPGLRAAQLLGELERLAPAAERYAVPAAGRPLPDGVLEWDGRIRDPRGK